MDEELGEQTKFQLDNQLLIAGGLLIWYYDSQEDKIKFEAI